jgi:phosphatidylinositol alpha-mannosyltransferase
VGEGGFDIVHTHEPTVPGLATAALRHTRGLIVATFHAETERARQLSDPQRPAQALRVAHRCAARGQHAGGRARRHALPGDYDVMARPHLPDLHPGRQDRHQGRGRVDGEGRGVARS